MLSSRPYIKHCFSTFWAKLGRAREEATYLIGLRIAELGDDDRARFHAHLAALGAAGQD